MSKCGICGNELLTGDIHWAIGICNDCYNKYYKSDERKYVDMLHKETGELLVNSFAEKDKQITELQKQLTDKKSEYKVLKILFDIVNNPKKDAMLKQIQGLQKKLDELKNKLKSQPKEIAEKIRKWGQRHYNWVGDGTGYDGQDYNECIGFNMAIDQLNELLDAILKEYDN